MTVEFRAVYAYKFGFTADGDAAGAAHSGSVYHDGIQGYIGGYFVFLRQQTNEFHHNGRADTEAFVYFLAFDNIFHTFRNQTFTAV